MKEYFGKTLIIKGEFAKKRGKGLFLLETDVSVKKI